MSDRAPGRPWIVSRLVVVGPYLATIVLCAYAAVLESAGALGRRWFWLDDDQMISMRYARNLIEGHGLVWNPGEHVEGYSNFGWTMCMAIVQWIVRDDALAALGVKLLALAVAGASIAASQRFERSIAAASLPLGAAVAAVSLDAIYWPANGFETTALTALLSAAVALRDERRRWLPCACLSLLPIVRSDAHVLWLAGCAIVARRGDRRWLVASTLPAVVHLLWRRWYYGDWFPNTYWLKVHAVPGRVLLGLPYAASFLQTYGAALAVVAIAAWTLRERLAVRVCGAVSIVLAYAAYVGGDVFAGHRLLAPIVPVLVVTAAWAARVGAPARFASHAILGAVAVPILLESPLLRPRSLFSDNGNPRAAMEVALALRTRAPSEASVAVFAAGLVPYFSRLRGVDLLGKCDRHVARLSAYPGERLAHNKRDFAHSLGKLRPDFVSAGLTPTWARLAPDLAEVLQMQAAYPWALSLDPIFRAHYFPNIVLQPGKESARRDDAFSLFARDDGPFKDARWPVIPLDVVR